MSWTTTFANHSMQVSKSIKDLSDMFAVALTINEILIFEILYLEKVGQGHGLQLSQWRHSMANIKIFSKKMRKF